MSMTLQGDYLFMIRATLLLLIPALQRVFILNLFFCRVLQKIIKLKPRSKYILAVDDSKNTLEEVVKVKFFFSVH